MNYPSIGRSLRKARKRLGMSQFDVAGRMGCSRAQVDNIEVARQRAPLHRLEDFAKVVGLRMTVQIVPRADKVVTVRTTGDGASLLNSFGELQETDRELIVQLVALLIQIPMGIRGTLRDFVAQWTERYAAKQDASEHPA
jgi:transcriptional regulator with XRE-family HTH domain